MPRAYDASSDAGDDDVEGYQQPEWDTDAYRSAMQPDDRAWQLQRDVLRDREDIDPDALADSPRLRHTDEAGETGGEGNRDVPEYLPPTEIGDSTESTDSVIAESLYETVEAAEQWTFEKTLEFVADAVHPGAGRLINMALKIKELLDNAEAAASRGSSRNLHVPLFDIAGGLAVDLNVHLRGADGSGDDAPPVSGFLSPGDGGLFGGWELEVDRHAETAYGEGSQSEQAARQAVERTDRARHHEPPASLVIEYNLSAVARQVKDPWRRAVVLREAASRLRTESFARPGCTTEPILVIYDPVAGLGMWRVNPDLSEAAAGRRIVIRLKVTTGLMTVFIE